MTGARILSAAQGLRLARVVWHEPGEVPAVGDPAEVPLDSPERGRHVLLELGDHLGSTSVVLDHATGELAERSTFYAYGGTESDYRPDRWKNFREDYRFTGKEEDVEVGLTYFGKRYLNAQLGRWVSADPLGVHSPGEADPSLYAYVHGALLRAIDPVGLDLRYTFDEEAKSLTIYVDQVVVDGSDAETAVIAKQMGRTWGKDKVYSVSYGGQEYQVQVKVSVRSGEFSEVRDGTNYIDTSEVGLNKTGANDLNMFQTEEGRTRAAGVSGNDQHVIRAPRERSKPGKVVPHETGHTLGHIEVGGRTNESGHTPAGPFKFANDIMAPKTSQVGPLRPENVSVVAERVLRSREETITRLEAAAKRVYERAEGLPDRVPCGSCRGGTRSTAETREAWYHRAESLWNRAQSIRNEGVVEFHDKVGGPKEFVKPVE